MGLKRERRRDGRFSLRFFALARQTQVSTPADHLNRCFLILISAGSARALKPAQMGRLVP
eukprot:3603634-Prymnesium_polylepis.3